MTSEEEEEEEEEEARERRGIEYYPYLFSLIAISSNPVLLAIEMKNKILWESRG